MEKLCVQERPNGKIYRARKPPTVEVFDAGWPEDECVLVLRVSEEDRETAREMAVEAAKINGCELVNSGHFGWWRSTVRNNESYWDYDSHSGAPGWYFNVE